MEETVTIDIRIHICIIILIIVGGGFLISHINNTYHKGCEEIGFEKFKYIEGMKYCEDKDGNLYYIKQKCNIFKGECDTKQITVGDVRVK